MGCDMESIQTTTDRTANDATAAHEYLYHGVDAKFPTLNRQADARNCAGDNANIQEQLRLIRRLSIGQALPLAAFNRYAIVPMLILDSVLMTFLLFPTNNTGPSNFLEKSLL